MKLKDTATMMTSEDEHERLKAEYLQAKIRQQEVAEKIQLRVKANLTMEERLPVIELLSCSYNLVGYIRGLERLAKIEGIDLKSLTI